MIHKWADVIKGKVYWFFSDGFRTFYLTPGDVMKKILYEDIPLEAREVISEDQKSYIDEFTFYRIGNDCIVAYYAGECLAVWDGMEWKS